MQNVISRFLKSPGEENVGWFVKSGARDIAGRFTVKRVKGRRLLAGDSAAVFMVKQQTFV